MRKSAFGWNEDTPAYESTTTVRVRYAETDAMGWVYYGYYFTYFEIGRTELMREFWRPYSEIEKEGYRLPVVSTGCRFLEGAKYDNLLNIVTRVSLLTAYRLHFDYRIILRDKKLCEGFTEHCFIGRNGKLIKVPSDLSKILKSQ